MHYGLRCYNKDSEAIGWLYTYNNDTELVWTIKNLNWCRQWKTERGAKKNFERYNSRWQFISKGGYLKIEVMPDIPESAVLDELGENAVSTIGVTTKMFRSQDYMNQEQRTVAEDFTDMIETEYALCVQEMRKANNAIVMDVPTGLTKEDNRRLDYANREIDSINKYWQIRLGHLIEFIETQNPKFNKELAIKYLSSGGK